MNLFNKSQTRKKQNKKTVPIVKRQVRPSFAQGPFTATFQSFIDRKFSKNFFEALREAVPLIDASIDVIKTIDGPVIAIGKNESLVTEIQEWLDNVRVNDLDTGYNFFDESLTDEALEQGMALGEFLFNPGKTDIIGLNVADTKTLRFKEEAKKALQIFQDTPSDIASDGRPLKLDNLVFFRNSPKPESPYGTPLFASCEFVSKAWVTIFNALANSWERFGDPSFKIIYKTSKKDEDKLASRKTAIQDELTEVVKEKRAGKSSDFVAVLDNKSEMLIEILGAKGEKLEVKEDARHIAEQVVTKSGLMPWMLGLAWQSNNDVADQQGALVSARSQKRQAAKIPLHKKIVSTVLTARNRTWKPGDWDLIHQQTNLQDVVKQAQAQFMSAEADAMIAGISLNNLPSNNDNANRKELGLLPHNVITKSLEFKKEDQRPTPWPVIDNLETSYEKLLKDWWVDFENQVNNILGFPTFQKSLHDTKRLITRQKQEDEVFTFSKGQEKSIIKALEEALKDLDVSDPDSELLFLYGEALSEGFVRGAEMLDQAVPIADLIRNKQLFDRIAKKGFKSVTDQSTKRILNKIIPALENVKPGTNPREVAGELRKLFDKGNADWERLARTEMTVAAEEGKVEEWKENDIKTVVFVPAPDTDSTCAAFAGEHPIDKAPIPGISTHPRCRCALRPA